MKSRSRRSRPLPRLKLSRLTTRGFAPPSDCKSVCLNSLLYSPVFWSHIIDKCTFSKISSDFFAPHSRQKYGGQSLLMRLTTASSNNGSAKLLKKVYSMCCAPPPQAGFNHCTAFCACKKASWRMSCATISITPPSEASRHIQLFLHTLTPHRFIPRTRIIETFADFRRPCGENHPGG